jgi:hypothetical protein
MPKLVKMLEEGVRTMAAGFSAGALLDLVQILLLLKAPTPYGRNGCERCNATSPAIGGCRKILSMRDDGWKTGEPFAQSAPRWLQSGLVGKPLADPLV